MFGLNIEEELRSINENQGYLPTPTRQELEFQPILSTVQIELLTIRQVKHPGKTVTEPARLQASLSEIKATFISESGWLSSSREADLVEALRSNKNWHFITISGGHWPMLKIPEKLTEVLVLSAVN